MFNSVSTSRSFNRGLESVDGTEVLRLCGGIGSPYSNKMLMLLRYRRIPFRWLIMHSPEELGTANARGPVLLPKILWPDGSVQNDSTFLIKRLEIEHSGRRSVVPVHRGLAFLCDILEDFADEFVTKCMYHFRWTKDAEFASRGIAMQQMGSAATSASIVSEIAKRIRDRQVGRLSIVGSNSVTGPAIERFFFDLVQALDEHLGQGHLFLLGSRPSAADFALLGQLHPMISLDPRTSSMVRERSGRLCAWYNSSFDLSGFSVLDESKGWLLEKDQTGAHLPASLLRIFDLIGAWYAPFMIANDRAFRSGSKSFKCSLDSGRVAWHQPTFKYQSKCLARLREDFRELPVGSAAFVRRSLAGTGVMALFDSAGPARL